MIPEPIAVTLLVTEALERLGVTYLVGGSFASTVHGKIRATLDSDLVANLRAEHVEPLVKALQPAFYIDEDMILAAIDRRSSFNVIHLSSMFKVDVFIPKGRAYDQEQMKRRGLYVVATEPDRTLYVASAEDVILSKLEWYRQGGGVCERHWRDVLGVINVQAERLDGGYLRQWAAELGVADLLEEALSQATAK